MHTLNCINFHTKQSLNFQLQKIYRRGADCEGFQCDDGKCIDNDQRCDRTSDCDNGEDEEDCNEGRFLKLLTYLNTISLVKLKFSGKNSNFLSKELNFANRKLFLFEA